MHGVRRDRSQQSAELKTQRKEHEARKLQVYLDVERAFFTLRKGSNLSHDALDATTRLLNINPEMYTAWNYRRRVLQHLLSQEGDVTGETTHQGGVGAASSSPASSREAQAPRQLLLEDLNLTMQALQMHPKVYWIWNHRRWCLQELSAVDSEDQDQQGIAKWRDELSVVNRMLERDARNFHGWNYRRYVLSQLAVPRNIDGASSSTQYPASLLEPLSLPPPLKDHQLQIARDEVKYTLAKIEANFSNFSAWHQRSLVLPALWTAQGLDDAGLRKARDDEFELVRQAMFVDPDDQSVWTYHEWLIDLDPSVEVLDRETASIQELLELEPESRWCMQALAHYYELYNDKGKRPEAHKLLHKLVKIDPDRKGRYVDMMAAAPAATGP